MFRYWVKRPANQKYLISDSAETRLLSYVEADLIGVQEGDKSNRGYILKWSVGVAEACQKTLLKVHWQLGIFRNWSQWEPPMKKIIELWKNYQQIRL